MPEKGGRRQCRQPNKNASSGPNSTTSNDHSPRPKSRTQSAPSSGKPRSSTLRQSRYATTSKAKPPCSKLPSRLLPAAPNPPTMKSFLEMKMMRKLKLTMMMETRRTHPTFELSCDAHGRSHLSSQLPQHPHEGQGRGTAPATSSMRLCTRGGSTREG